MGLNSPVCVSDNLLYIYPVHNQQRMIQYNCRKWIWSDKEKGYIPVDKCKQARNFVSEVMMRKALINKQAVKI